MLSTEQTDTLCAELACNASVVWVVGVGADTHLAVFVNQTHKLLEARILRSVHQFQLAHIGVTLGSVQCESCALFEFDICTDDFCSLVNYINVQSTCTNDAAFTPATGNQSGVRCHTTTSGENTVGGTHTLNVLRVGLLTDKNNFLALLVPSNSIFSSEDNFTNGSARTCRQTFNDWFNSFLFRWVQNWVKQLVELRWVNAQNSGLLINQTFVKHIHCHIQSGGTCTFADAALQHKQLAFLNGELDVEHIVERFLKNLADFNQLLICSRHSLLHTFQMLVLLVLGLVVKRIRCADTSHNVLALSVDKPLTVEQVLASGRVTGECNAGCRSIAHVAEYHRLNVYGSTPIVRNTLDTAVRNGFLTVPALEHGFDTAHQLLFSVIWEFFAQNNFDFLLELVGKELQVVGAQVSIRSVAFLFLVVVEHIVELFADVEVKTFSFFHHNIGIHHNQTAVRVPYETLVAGLLDKSRDCGRADTNVEHCVHHTRH